jgi:saxitoxin biosynthesis operon SxtJ-like protein
MQWSDLPLNPPDRMLRQFAGLWILFFGATAVWQGYFREHHAVAWMAAVLALTAGPVGLLWPRRIRPLYAGWLIATFPVGWAVSRLSLLVAYYLVVTPLGLAARLVRRDRLMLRPPPKRESYWRPLGENTDVRSYFRQY